jgi:hypothetical protein
MYVCGCVLYWEEKRTVGGKRISHFGWEKKGGKNIIACFTCVYNFL